MSVLAATQIPKPSDEQAFERASVSLWQGLLNDPNVQLVGRRGQDQDGVDLFGRRNGDPQHLVGIQCKVKGHGRRLTETEVRDEVAKALQFKPPLREYFITTTAPDDAPLQVLARELSADLKLKGRDLAINIWGWNTLEQYIAQFPRARKQFDPSYTAYGEQVIDRVTSLTMQVERIATQLGVNHAEIIARIDGPRGTPNDTTTATNILEVHLDAQVDEYRELHRSGKATTALSLLQNLLSRAEASASGRILFRIKANMAFCYLMLGEDARCADLLSEAYDHAPSEPKAIANKALSLMLQGHWEVLLAFGIPALWTDNTNGDLASYLIQAAARAGNSVDSILDLMPTPARQAAPVSNALAYYFRYRGDGEKWRQAARDSLLHNPDNSDAMRLGAEADLDEILDSDEFQRTRMLSTGDRTRVEVAAEVLISQWDSARTTEGKLGAEAVDLGANAIAALHALNRVSEGIAIGRQLLALAPSDATVAGRTALAAIEGGDEDLARQALRVLPDGTDKTLLTLRLHVDRGDWAAIADLYTRSADDLPESERPLVAAIGRVAERQLSAAPVAPDEILGMLDGISEDPRAAVVVADFAESRDLKSIGSDVYQEALRRIGPHSHIAERLMVAMSAARRGEWNVVADLLDGHVDTAQDSDDLRALATALVNDNPIRQRAVRFFSTLPETIRGLPYYTRAEGLMHFNRGALGEAESRFRSAVEAQPDIANHLALFATLRRKDREGEIGPILQAINIDVLVGSARDKMVLARELLAAGQGERAVAFAYQVLQLARNDPKVGLMYFGLMVETRTTIPPASRVGIDTWVKLRADNGDAYAFLLVEEPSRPAEGMLSRTHPLAAAAFDLSAGDRFAMPSAMGEEIIWEIVELKHKYVHALHDTLESFNTRFPDERGFYRLSFKDGDIAPVLGQVRRTSEINRELADLYLLHHVPMSMVASRQEQSVVAFANYVTSIEKTIESCLGTAPERAEALDTILKHRGKGAVLDAYAAWTVVTMDAFDVLRSVFPSLVVARSTIDDLRKLVHPAFRDGEDMMTLHWRDGQFFRETYSAAELEENRRHVQRQIETIERFCDVRPIAAPDNPSELSLLLTDRFGEDVLDTAYIAGEGYVLISEDMHYRQMASGIAQVPGVWLQAILLYARDHGQVTVDRYATMCIGLSYRRHGHITLDASTLVAALHEDRTSSLHEFRNLATYLGTRNADMHSHVSVIVRTLAHIWRLEKPALGLSHLEKVVGLREKLATSIMLESVIRFRTRDWADVLVWIKQEGTPGLAEYVAEWVRGHFLAQSEIARAEGSYADMKQRLMR